MEDDLENGRWPRKWKMTSKMEDDLENGRWPQKWTTPSKPEDYIKNVPLTSKRSLAPQNGTRTSQNGWRPQKTDDDLENIIEEVDEDGSGTLDFDGKFLTEYNAKGGGNVAIH